MRFSVGVFPSFSSFSQTITCKKGVAPGLALFSLRPATLLYNGGASPGGRSSRPSHPFLPSSVTDHPSFPSLRHRHPTIASTVSQLPWGEAARAPPYGHGNAHAGSVLSFFGSLGGGAGVTSWGGVRSQLKLWGEEPDRLNNKYGGWVLLFVPRALPGGDIRQLWPRGPFHLGSKHGGWWDIWESFVVSYLKKLIIRFFYSKLRRLP